MTRKAGTDDSSWSWEELSLPMRTLAYLYRKPQGEEASPHRARWIIPVIALIGALAALAWVMSTITAGSR